MTDEKRLILPLCDCRDIALVGGKAVNLARLINAGFDVPGGFVVTTDAFRRAAKKGKAQMTDDLAAAIKVAYRDMGCPKVAVRSSATAEDTAEASMAGQYRTFLNVKGEDELLHAVENCWHGLDTARTRAYLEQHNINVAEVAMAVIVQELIPAEVAGVMFTANPRNGSKAEMLIEAAWGLGEAVVSGKVQPDTLILDRATGRVKQSVIADKKILFEPASGVQSPVPKDRRKAPCLAPHNIAQLWELGQRIKTHFGSQQDIEWAIHADRVYILQSRAITTLEDAESYERCLHETTEQLRELIKQNRGPWVRHNIAETLPHPTPLTWSIIGEFMSGRGGFGIMYKQIGFEPSKTVSEEGFLELIAGHIYMDLSRSADMFFENFPFSYDINLLRCNPDAAQSQPTVPSGSKMSQYRVGKKLARINKRLESLAEDYDRKLENQIIPAFIEWVRDQKRSNPPGLSVEEFLELWNERSKRVLDDFAPKALLPGLLTAMALEELRSFIREHFWQDDADELVNRLAVSSEPDHTIKLNQGLFEIATGTQSVEDWLEQFGHRAPEEFDLAANTWQRQPEIVRKIASHLKGGIAPIAMHEKRLAQANLVADKLHDKLCRRHGGEFRRLLNLLRRFLRFREDSKHYLMMGYDLLRDLTLEAGRRLQIGDDVFLLNFEELRDSLNTGSAPADLIAQRRRLTFAQARLTLPSIITKKEIATLGQPPHHETADRIDALCISSGFGAGPARIVFSPRDAGKTGAGYVLVCPSTDPSWTPLFVNAAALVLECGGTLSHGAVVAREMGIPAVVLPGATRLFKNGEIISVDGRSGSVSRSQQGEKSASEQDIVNPDDVRIAHDLAPPVPGPCDRAAARVANVFFAIWILYLTATFLLPKSWLYQPSMDLLDTVLWPIVISLGKPATVAAVAVFFALFTMVGQRLLTDNRRLNVAKNRANRLRRLGSQLPKDSPRRSALLKQTTPVQIRILRACFVSLAVILGPMIMSFVWFPRRMDPASWSPKPGTTVDIVATIDGEFLYPVTFKPDTALTVEPTTPLSQSTEPIRPILEKLLAGGFSDLPIELRPEEELTPDQLRADLADYLRTAMPPQNLSWTVYTPQGRPGRFSLKLATAHTEPISFHLVLGDSYPPEPKQISFDADSPIRSVQMIYHEQKTQAGPVFFAPFKTLGWPNWDAGWLLTYIAVYLPVMFLLRRLLRIP